MTPKELAEIQMCDECISHLMENAGPDHIIVKYRTALIKLQEQAEEIKRLEDALVEERARRSWRSALEDYDQDDYAADLKEARQQLRAEGEIR
jgi:hypothetical protein